MYRRVLVPLDGSHFGELALPTALSLAERFGAELRIITVASPTTGSSQPRDPGVVGDESRDRARSRAGEYLNEVEARIRAGGFDDALAGEVIPAGNAAHSVFRDAVESEADLIVMTTHGRGPIRRAWLGSTADGVIRRSPRPVLLLRPDGDLSEEPVDLAGRAEPVRKILIPLDGSRAGELLLGLAAPLSADDAEVRLLRVVPPFLPGGSPYLPHVVREGEDHETVKKAAEGYLADVTGRFAEGGRTVVAEVATGGQPGVTILRVAKEEGIDLIAMSSHGRGGVSRLLLGSVADKVIRGAPCPILVYREPEEES